ncbi:TetR/AcrR family transcriptional regulator [Desulfosporosinus shakirovi]|uniref:TetR/AcrR family transcriptional regulator n=1 Tax=Desulfosporosinus shakirovi TaxID=2885154 RepID=UPI001E33E63E|nr:TetR/AcrR family transcriptional regulator [Desulfosporosinus sp. SRJS8]MCB8818044.1 TetR/AcrR family transcriptional regulator [Desulfosporosinus sp. SRJS8]
MSESEAKEKIMSAVRELLAESCPVGDITVRKIAQRAGVGIGTVSYHFHSKDRLVYEVIAAQMSDLAGGLSPNAGEGTPLERLRRFFSRTVELALKYSEIFKAQLSYEIVNSDMSICYFITPLLKEHFGSSKSDLEIKVTALQMIVVMQVILLKMEEFQRYTGVNIRDVKQREEALDAILSTAVQVTGRRI